jgi:protein gp37
VKASASGNPAAAPISAARAPAQYHRPFSEVQLIPARLSLPLRWTKPHRIFADSMSDLFHADVPDHFLASVFAIMHHAPRHAFQVLTKRPQRMRKLLSDPERLWAALLDAMWHILADQHRKHGQPEDVWPLPNVWLGTSVENQEAAYRIDWLVKTPAAVRFLSCEPLLGQLDFEQWLYRLTGEWHIGEYGKLPVSEPSGDLHWVIAGGESGPDFRPVDPHWVRELQPAPAVLLVRLRGWPHRRCCHKHFGRDRLVPQDPDTTRRLYRTRDCRQISSRN